MYLRTEQDACISFLKSHTCYHFLSGEFPSLKRAAITSFSFPLKIRPKYNNINSLWKTSSRTKNKMELGMNYTND